MFSADPVTLVSTSLRAGFSGQRGDVMAWVQTTANYDCYSLGIVNGLSWDYNIA